MSIDSVMINRNYNKMKDFFIYTDWYLYRERKNIDSLTKKRKNKSNIIELSRSFQNNRSAVVQALNKENRTTVSCVYIYISDLKQ